MEPEQQNQSLLPNNPGSAPKTPPAPTPKAEAEKAKEKDSDRDFDFKTSIWDYLFGGTVQPRRNPKSFEDFEAQVNASIKHLNESVQKSPLELVQRLDLVSTVTDKSADWDRVHNIEIQDAKGCFTYNPYRRLLATWDTGSIWIYQFDKAAPEGLKLIQVMKDFKSPLLLHHAVTFTRDCSSMLVVTQDSIRCFGVQLNHPHLKFPDRTESIQGRFWKPQQSPHSGDEFAIVDKFFYESLEIEGIDDLGNTFKPDSFCITLASKRCLVKVAIEILMSLPDNSADENYGITSPICSIKLKKITMLAPEMLHDAFVNYTKTEPSQIQKIILSGLRDTFAALIIEPSQIKIRQFQMFIHSNAVPNSDKFKISSEMTFPFSIDPDLVFEMPDPQGTIILVASNQKALYSLEFLRQGTHAEMKKVMELPKNINAIHHISFAQGGQFILMNANVGELFVWARLNDGMYGKVLYLDLEYELTQTYMTPDLDYILLLSPNQIRSVYFDPQLESWDYYTIFKISKDLRRYLGSDFKPEEPPLNLSLIVNEHATIVVQDGGVWLYDPAKQLHQQALHEKSLASHEDPNPLNKKIESASLHCPAPVEIYPSRAWLLYISFSDSIEDTAAVVDEPKKLSHYFKIYGVSAKETQTNTKQIESNLTYKLELLYSKKTNSLVNYVHCEKVCIFHEPGDSQATAVKVWFTPDLEWTRQFHVQTNTFDLQDRLGVHALEEKDQLLVRLASRDLGLVITDPEKFRNGFDLAETEKKKGELPNKLKLGTSGHPGRKSVVDPLAGANKDKKFKASMEMKGLSTINLLVSNKVKPIQSEKPNNPKLQADRLTPEALLIGLTKQPEFSSHNQE